MKKFIFLGILLFSVSAYAAGTKIGDFDSGTPLQDTDETVFQRGASSNVKGALLDIYEYISSKLSTDCSITNAAGTLKVSQCPGRTITGTTDTITADDAGVVIRYNNASGVAVTLPSATSTGFTSGFAFTANNIGAGSVTITPTVSSINGAASFVIPEDTGCYIYSDGTNYQIDYASCSALPLALDTLPANMTKRSFGVSIDGGGAAITTGLKGHYRVPFDGTITGYSLQSDAVGSAVIDVWKINNDLPVLADTITASTKPTLSSDNYVYSTTLTGWTTDVHAGDVIGYNVDSASTMTKLTFQLFVTVAE